MHITLDSNPCDCTEATTVGEAIEFACQAAHQQGRIVVQVDVDGRTLDAAELGDPKMNASTAETIALTSLAPRQVLAASLDLGMHAIEAANERFAAAAHALQSGDTAEATAPLQEGIELWQTLDEHVLREAVPTILHTMMEPADAEEFDALVKSLHTELASLHAAISSGDPSALGDALLYEFPETAARWKTFFTKCMDAVKTKEQDATEAGS